MISVWVTNVWRSDFAYDGKFRRRIRKEFNWQYSTWVQTSEAHYVYDRNLVLQERDINNLPTISYTRGRDLSGSLQGAGGIGGLLARTDQSILNSQPFSANAHAFYHADANGNVTALINALQIIVARYEYDPFGSILSSCGPLADANLYRFSSKEYHVNSGLVYYLYRFYDPNSQRWLSRDRIAERGGWNLYRYSLNSPVGFVDTDGLGDYNPNQRTLDGKSMKQLPTPTPPVPDQNLTLPASSAANRAEGAAGIPDLLNYIFEQWRMYLNIKKAIIKGSVPHNHTFCC